MSSLTPESSTGIGKTIIGREKYNARSWYCQEPLVVGISARDTPTDRIMPDIKMDA